MGLEFVLAMCAFLDVTSVARLHNGAQSEKTPECIQFHASDSDFAESWIYIRSRAQLRGQDKPTKQSLPACQHEPNIVTNNVQ